MSVLEHAQDLVNLDTLNYLKLLLSKFNLVLLLIFYLCAKNTWYYERIKKIFENKIILKEIIYYLLKILIK